jgi:chemotaxis protein histidine kinase CheA
MNGKIEVMSEPKQGSLFKIILPVNQSKKFKAISVKSPAEQEASGSV